MPKCNRLDARATPSGHGLVIEAFSASLERQLQLNVRMLGQAVRTPSAILDIHFTQISDWDKIGVVRKLTKNAVN